MPQTHSAIGTLWRRFANNPTPKKIIANHATSTIRNGIDIEPIVAEKL
jgi:hypothetical protein